MVRVVRWQQESIPMQIMPSFLTEDTALARHSLSRLREFGDVVLLPGHGDAWQGRMDEAVNRALGSCKPARH